MLTTSTKYYDELVLKIAIDSLTPSPDDSDSDDTREFWTALLHYFFPLKEGYMMSCTATNAGDRADFMGVYLSQLYQREVDGTGTRGYKFLLVEYNFIEYEGQDARWEECVSELQDYLTQVHLHGQRHPVTDEPLALPSAVYGAVAVGRYVRFYTYDRQTERVSPIQNYDRRMHLVTDRQTVQQLFDFIRSSPNSVAW